MSLLAQRHNVTTCSVTQRHYLLSDTMSHPLRPKSPAMSPHNLHCTFTNKLLECLSLQFPVTIPANIT